MNQNEYTMLGDVEITTKLSELVHEHPYISWCDTGCNQGSSKLVYVAIFESLADSITNDYKVSIDRMLAVYDI